MKDDYCQLNRRDRRKGWAWKIICLDISLVIVSATMLLLTIIGAWTVWQWFR